MGQLGYNILLRRFVGLAMDDPVRTSPFIASAAAGNSGVRTPASRSETKAGS